VPPAVPRSQRRPERVLVGRHGILCGAWRTARSRLSLRQAPPRDVPIQTTNGYIVEMVWHSITFDRMQAALRKFAVEEQASREAPPTASCSGHHDPARCCCCFSSSRSPSPASSSTRCWATPWSRRPRRLRSGRGGCHAPHLPELNHSQAAAVRAVISRPLSLIQVRGRTAGACSSGATLSTPCAPPAAAGPPWARAKP